jgi:hypothetical protein
MDKRIIVASNLELLESILTDAYRDYETDTSTFYKKNIFKLGRFIRAFAELLQILNLSSSEKIKIAFECLEDEEEPNSKDSLTNRLELFINNWNKFLDKIQENVLLVFYLFCCCCCCCLNCSLMFFFFFLKSNINHDKIESDQQNLKITRLSLSNNIPYEFVNDKQFNIIANSIYKHENFHQISLLELHTKYLKRLEATQLNNRSFMLLVLLRHFA